MRQLIAGVPKFQESLDRICKTGIVPYILDRTLSEDFAKQSEEAVGIVSSPLEVGVVLSFNCLVLQEVAYQLVIAGAVRHRFQQYPANFVFKEAGCSKRQRLLKGAINDALQRYFSSFLQEGKHSREVFVHHINCCPCHAPSGIRAESPWHGSDGLLHEQC